MTNRNNQPVDFVQPDALWALLTPSERQKFTQAFRDPSSELAQQLLVTEELEKQRQQPWWEAPLFPTDESISKFVRKRYDGKPVGMHVPEEMVKPLDNRPYLVYNICAVW